MKAVAFALLCAACTDPVVQMDVQVAQVSNMDLSCVGGLYALADGKNRGTGTAAADNTHGCVPVSGLTNMSDVPGLLRDKLSLDMPASGLIGVELSGITGTCDAPGIDVFYGGVKYIGQDSLSVTLAPQVSCAHDNLTIRPLDLFAMTADPTHACPAAIPNGPNTGMSYGVVEQTLFDGPQAYFGPSYYLNNGVMSVSDWTPVTNPSSCLTASFGQTSDGKLSADGCLRMSPNTVCAQPGEIEVAAVNYILMSSLYSVAPDPKFGNLVLGAVWGIDATGKKAPLVGATVTVDPSKGRVVYADLASASSSPTVDTSATAAKASGLFVVYTNEFVDLQVSAPGYTPETVRVAPVGGFSDATVLVALKHQ
jgi:hypothetical protein